MFPDHDAAVTQEVSDVSNSAKSLYYSDYLNPHAIDSPFSQDNTMPRIDTALDFALLAAKTANSCCETPVLHFLKPATALAVIICETARVN